MISINEVITANECEENCDTPSPLSDSPTVSPLSPDSVQHYKAGSFPRYHRRYYYRGSKARAVTCSNCSGRGHLFKECKKPIRSYGVLAWTFDAKGELRICLIQRRHTISYEAFIRGKYDIDELKLHRERMTIHEKHAIQNNDWDVLYDNIMNNKQIHDTRPNSNLYSQRERQRAKHLYDSINIEKLFENTPETITEPTWEFPKGRKFLQETEQECALREFQEETGIPLEDVTIITNFHSPIWFEEVFCGINKRQYHNRYLLAYLKPDSKGPFIDKTNDSQMSEVQDSRYFTFDEAMAIIHPFHQEKQECLRQSFEAIKKIIITEK